MEISQDYEDLFKILNEYKIKYLIVGAYAVMYYSVPRYTKDIDVWINSDVNDPQEIYNALKDFGAPLVKITPDDFKDKHMIFQIGMAPVRIDIITNVPGADFNLAWKNRKRVKYGKTPICIISKEELIKSKKHAKRPQDKIDIERITKK